MKRPPRSFLALVLVLSAAAFAQQAEDPKREAAALVELARSDVDRGGWTEATKNLNDALAADPANADAPFLLAQVYEQQGLVKEALAALAKVPDGPRVLTRRGELLLETGDAEGAEKAARAALAADAGHLPALRLLGQIFEETGRREDATTTYESVNKLWAKSEGEDSDDVLLAVARARSGLFRVSDEYKADADAILSRYEPLVTRREPPGPLEAFVEAGDLYLRSTQDQHALKWYKKAAERNPHYAPAIYGLARQMAFRFDDIGAAREAERALKENPRYVPALLHLALVALGDGEYDKAEKRIDEAAATDPVRAETRAARAALHYLRGAQGAFDGEVKAILARNKFASVAWRTLAEALEEQRRFAEALTMAKKAVATDPRDFEARFLVARNHLNVGEDDAAVKALKDAEKDDPCPNLYRRNFLTLFEKIKNFRVYRDPRFVTRIPIAEHAPYLPLIQPAMEASLAMLEKKWGFPSELPLYVSIFDSQDDFATRTIGLPGFPALGACFGRVVTLDSPRALPPSAFGWRAVQHHELAHVITLQLSKGRVPRWLTEGASVYEERKVSPQWWREMERDVVDALASGEVLTLDNINNAFRGQRVLYAYYQGGLMCELIERDFGFDKLREMVRLYGEGLETKDVVRRALGIEPAEFDRRFLVYAKEHVKDQKVLPRPSGESVNRLRMRLRKDKDDADGWWTLALGQVVRTDTAGALDSLTKLEALRPKDPRGAAVRALVARRQSRPDQAAKFANEAIDGGFDVYDLRMLLAQQARTAKDFEGAKKHLRRAIELFPRAPGHDGPDGEEHDGPRRQLANLLFGEGDAKFDEAMALLRAQSEVDENDFGTRLKLASYYRNRAKTDDELQMLVEIRDVAPLPNGPWDRVHAIELHERIAEIQLERKAFAEAEVAARLAAEVAVMDLGPKANKPADKVADDDRRGALLAKHAETLRLLGRADEAKHRAEEALRLAPENPDALDVIRKLGS